MFGLCFITSIMSKLDNYKTVGFDNLMTIKERATKFLKNNKKNGKT
jgi:hypothetical protein